MQRHRGDPLRDEAAIAHALRQADPERLAREAGTAAEEARRAFGGLGRTQLNWKPSPAEWSVGQCFDHLIRSTTPFFPIFERILAGTSRPTLWERVPLVPGLMASMLIRVLDPEHGMKVRAPSVWLPTESSVEPEVLDTFAAAQRRLAELMRAIPVEVARATVITSPASAFVTYRVLDAYRIMVLHALLHLGQARRVAAATGFPRPSASP